MDSISEIIPGVNINSQEQGLTDFCKASINMYTVGFKRLVKPWLHPNFIYNNLPDKPIQDEIMRNLGNFLQEAIIESWRRRKLVQNGIRPDLFQ